MGRTSPDVEAFRSAGGGGGDVVGGGGGRTSPEPVAQPQASSRIPDPAGRRAHRAVAILRLLRPHQWVKNLLVFVPLLLAHEARDLHKLAAVAAACAALCLCASAVYVTNDAIDLARDREHPTKRSRPFASGELPVAWAVPLALALLLAATGVVALAGIWGTGLLLAIYVIVSTAYSLALKNRLLIDVLVLAGLYTFRLQIGATAGGGFVSQWLMAFAMFLFLSLAFAKRYVELRRLMAAAPAGAPDPWARGYSAQDTGVIETVGPCSGYLAVLVMALYLSSDKVRQMYRHPDVLWLLCVLLLYWVTRIWFLARRGTLDDDPVLFALRDSRSWMLLILAVAVAWLAV
jgi:4-hydroxybenzoate polyprenyltransferase